LFLTQKIPDSYATLTILFDYLFDFSFDYFSRKNISPPGP